jgi:hypothetical protein
MKQLRVYIENSVIGGYFDALFEEATKKLFNSVNLKEGYNLLEIRTPLEIV